MMNEAPFMYVSGIATYVGLVNNLVTPRENVQNTVATHNAAIALAWLLPDVIAALQE